MMITMYPSKNNGFERVSTACFAAGAWLKVASGTAAYPKDTAEAHGFAKGNCTKINTVVA